MNDASPLLSVLGTPSDAVGDWLSAGQALERVLLIAASAGVQASYLNQPCQLRQLRPRLREAIGVTGFPQIALRMGYPEREVEKAGPRQVEAVLELAP